MLDKLLTYIITNPKKTVSLLASILVFLCLVFFFINNSILFVSTSGPVSNKSNSLEVYADSKKVLSVFSFSIIPRPTKIVEISTENESTMMKYDQPLLFSKMTFFLDSQKMVNKLVSPIFSSHDCGYKNNKDMVYSWQCGAYEAQIQTTAYSHDKYPQVGFFNDKIEPLMFPQLYKKGIIGFTNRDKTTINYTDLSSDNPVSSDTKVVELDDGTYPTNSVLLIDSKNSNSFIVLNSKTNTYYSFIDGIASKSSVNALPSEKGNGVYGNSYQYYNGKLYIYYGASSIDLSHGDTSNDQMRVDIVDVTNNKIIKSINLKNDTYCDTVVFAEDAFGCSNSSLTRIINYEGVDKITLESTGGVVNLGGSIGVINNNSLYRYMSTDNSLRKIYSANNQKVSSIIPFSSGVIIKTFFSKSYGDQIGVIYKFNLEEDADYNSLEYSLPLTTAESDDLVSSIDYWGNTIYAKTAIPGSDPSYGSRQISNDKANEELNNNRKKLVQILDKKGINTNDYKIVVSY